MSRVSARERLLGGTIELMRREGAAGMGISELIAASGVARRSLYLNFPGGKDELVAEATSVAGRHVSAGLRGITEPLDLVRLFVASWRTVLVESEFTSGCPVAAAALAGGSAPSGPPAAGKAFAAWRERIASRLEEAGLPQAEAAALAYVTLSAVEGAVLVCLAERSLAAMEAVEQHLVGMIEARLEA